MTAFAGWEMPVWYSSSLAEHRAVREACGVFDVSHMGRTWVSGPEAAAVLASVFSRDPARLAAGESEYALACNEEGGIIDDLLIYRLGEQRYLVINNAAGAGRVGQLIAGACLGQEAAVEAAQDTTVLLAVQGPEAPALLARLLGDAISAIARHGCAEIDVKGTRFFLARTGYTGEDGFEIMISIEAGGRLLRQLVAAGCPPCGLAARDSLRLEAALPLHGSDIDETTLPWEAGLGWAVELDHEFPGRPALLATKDRIERRLACLVSDGEGVFRHGFPILFNGEEVGAVTSGGFSPTLGRSIAMGYLPRSLAREGTELTIRVREKDVPCHVVRRPFYKAPAPVPSRGSGRSLVE